MDHDQDVWERAPLLIHVGLHKTGTTWLAENLFNRPGDEDFAACLDLPLLYRLLITPSARAFSSARVRRELAPLATRAVEENRIVALLGENLAGRPFHSRYYREMNLKRLAETFPGAKILLTIREQDSIILSMYGQFVRFGYTNSLDEFLAVPPDDAAYEGILDYEFYDYDKLYTDYTSVFGEENVAMIPYEQFIRDTHTAVSGLSDLLGRRLSFQSEQPDKMVNPAWSDLAFTVARHANRFRSRETPWLNKSRFVKPMSMAYWADRFTPKGVHESGRRAAREKVREAVGSYYEESNATIAHRLGVDLAAYGYRVAGRPSEQQEGSLREAPARKD